MIEGPDKESVEAAHRAAHGMLPANVVEVDEANVRGFFGRLNTHPPGEPYAESAFRAILFTDMVDSTRLTQQLGDRGAMQLLRQHDSIVRSALAQFGGSEVKHTGDGIMAAFASASQAVGAAIAGPAGAPRAQRRRTVAGARAHRGGGGRAGDRAG